MYQPSFSEFVLKIASRCNLDCGYCYEYNLGDNSWRKQPKTMSLETARLIGLRIQEHASTHGIREVSIGLHGGEPLLVGPKLLDELCITLRDSTGPGCSIHFGMQTNGVLLTDDVVRVIESQSIAVSVSLDGARAAHDRHRLKRNGSSSYDATLQGINRLRGKAPQALVGALGVIDLANDPVECFDALAKLGTPSIDFLLPHHTWDNPPPRPPGAITPYADWYFALFLAWVQDRHPGVSIRFLENIVSQLAGGPSVFEAMTLAPPGLIVVATDGSIEAVDCLKSTGSGVQQTGLHLKSSTFDDAFIADIVRIRFEGEAQLSDVCQSCKHKVSCAGGYFPHRWKAGVGFDNPSVYCGDLFVLIDRIAEHLSGLCGGMH